MTTYPSKEEFGSTELPFMCHSEVDPHTVLVTPPSQ